MYFFIVSCLWFVMLSFFPFAGIDGAEEKKRSVDTGGEQIQDTVYMKLEQEEEAICIDSAVYLKCPDIYKDEDILYYKWTNNLNSEVYTTRNIWVSPRDTVTYTLEIAYVDASHNLIRNGDFEMGTAGRETFFTEYVYKTSEASNALYKEGVYKIAQNAHRYHPNFVKLPDHTSGQGYMMVVNGNTSERIVVWKQEIQHINIGQQYAFSAWAATVSEGAQPLLHFSINNTSLSDESLSDEFKPPYGAGWQRFYYIWTADKAEASISLVDMSTAQSGNDFAIDDISFMPVKLLSGHTKIKILPRLELNELRGVCEGEGMPSVIGTGITAYEWRKTGTDWVSREARPDLSVLGAESVGEYTCRIQGYCDEKQDTFRILPVLRVGSFQDTVTICPNGKDTLAVEAEGMDLRYTWWDLSLGKFLTDRSFCPVETEGRYECMVESVCGDSTLVAVVNRIPVWLEHPRDTVVCTGEEVVWVVKSSLKGAVPEWTLPDLTVYTGDTLRPVLAGTYSYRIVTCGSEELKGKVSLGLHPFPGVPDFPEDTLRYCVGEPFRLASPFDEKGLYYRWSHSGQVFSTDTAFALTLTSADTGWYALQIEDACGLTRSDSVYVYLYRKPEVKTGPQPGNFCPGATVTLAVQVGGDVSDYVWSRGEGKEDRLVVADISYADSGSYRCEVQGHCGEDTVVSYTLNLLRLPEIVSISPDTLIFEGADYRLGVVARGDSLEYRWARDENLYPGTDPFLLFHPVTFADSGTYRVKVENRCGDTTAYSRLRTKWELLPEDKPLLEVCEGTDTVLKVKVADKTGLSFTWYHEDRLLEGRETDTLFLAAVGLLDSGDYRCVVKGRGWQEKRFFHLKVADSVRVSDFSGATFLCEGEAGKWTVTATGEGVAYTWEGGEGWEVQQDSMYVKNKVALSDAGFYRCTVSGRCGEKRLENSLDIKGKIAFWTEPSDTVVCAGAGLSWKVGTADPETVVRWWSPAGEVYLGPEINLEVVEKEQEGLWSYRGESRCDTTEIHTVQLSVHPFLGKLQLPSDSVMKCPKDAVRWGAPLQDAGLRYRWTKENRVLATDSILGIPDLSLTGEGYYRLQITDACGLSQEDSIKVSFFPSLQVITNGESKDLCVGETDTLKVSASGAGLRYRWNRQQGRDSVYCLEQVTLADSGIYACTVSDRCNREEEVVWTVTVNALPEIRFELPAWVGACRDTLSLAGIHPAGGVAYVNGLPAKLLRFGEKEKVYRILYDYTDLSTHCRDTASYTIQVDQPPFVSLQEDTVTGACRPVSLCVREATPGKIRWYGEEGELPCSDPRQLVYVPALADSGARRYTVRLTDPYGCLAEDSVQVRVVPLPFLKLMKDTVAGACREIVLTGMFRGEGIAGIVWEPEKKIRPLDAYRAEVTGKKEGENVFWASVTDRFGCRAADTVTVTVVETLFPQDREACEGDSLRVDMQKYVGYEWEDGYGEAVRLLEKAGVYLCTVKDHYGCSAEVVYTVHPQPVFTLKDTFIFEGQTFRFLPELADESYGPYRIRWWDGQEGSESSEVREAGSYRLEISDRIGCRAGGVVSLEVKKRAIAAPDAFLPASTGENSRFYLKEVNFVQDFRMYIYNRWGELVFETRQIGFNGGWDGTFKGTDCLPGAYLWVAVSDGQVVGRGTVMLVR